MKTTSYIHSTALSLALLLSALPSGARPEWFFEAGPFYRGDMKISVDGGSRAADTGTQAATPSVVGGLPFPILPPLNDDGSAAVLRTFDNGFVGPSGWVWAQGEGITQHFAYVTAGQYDAGAQTLSFTGTVTGGGGVSSRTTTRVNNIGPAGWNDSKRTHGRGLIGTLGYRFVETEEPEDGEVEENKHEWSLLFRFGWLDGMGGNFRNRSTLHQEVTRRQDIYSSFGTEQHLYTYDTLGNPFFPSAPYTMGDPAGVGPLIADTPESITQLSRSDNLSQIGSRGSLSRATGFVDLDVDVEAFTFQFGPRWMWEAPGGFSLYLQPALTVNLIDASADRRETLRTETGEVIASWDDSADDQSWRWGGGIQFGASVGLSENWYLNGSGGYEWVDSADLNVGSDRVRIDISGYQLELALGRSF